MKISYRTLYEFFEHNPSFSSQECKKPAPIAEDYEKPKFVKIIQNVPLTAETKVKEIPIAEFEGIQATRRNISDYTWTDVNRIPYGIKTQFDQATRHDNQTPKMEPYLKDYIENPPDLALFDSKQCQFIVIARKPIKVGSMVSFYSGLLQPITYSQKINRHSIQVKITAPLFSPVEVTGTRFSLPPQNTSQVFAINGDNCGNYGTLLPHLPNEGIVPKELRKLIATANLLSIAVYYKKYPHYALLAAQPINEGDIMGFSV